MHAERDYLVRFVFPELRSRCAKRRLHLIDVDLRWGVTEEDTEKGRILEVCLDEIDRCRPFFVGLLGERFGWVPPDYRVPGESRYDWVRTFPSGFSITGLEIYHGALKNPEQAQRSFFYFRDPSFIQSVPEEYRSIFTPENQASAEKLRKMKEEIQRRFSGVAYYTCSFRDIDQRGRVQLSGLEPWGIRVLEDLWQAICREYPEKSGVADELAAGRSYHEAFIESSARRFVGRRDVLNKMISLAEDEQVPFFIVSGRSGYGKSALLAQFARIYGQRHPDIFILPHFCGVGPGSTDIRQTIIRLCKELITHYGLDEEVPYDDEELRPFFSGILNKTAAIGKTVILVDALNQLDETSEVLKLGWIPDTWPNEVTLVLSTLSDAHLKVLLERKRPPIEIALGALTLKDRKTIIRQTLWDYRKKLDERPGHDQMAVLLAKRESDSPLFLTVACEELRVFGEFEKVDEYLKKIPEEVPQLLEQVLERLEQDHGKALVEGALSMLRCSKQGLLESELLELLRKEGETQMPRAVWARLYRSLQTYVRPPGESGESTLDFFHGQVAQAAWKRYLLFPHNRALIHQRLAVYFLQKADPGSDRSWRGDYPRALKYLPYHLSKGGLDQELFDLARDEAFLGGQRDAFPSDPHLPLETLHTALKAAGRIDHAPVMAEFLLSSARHVQDIKNESPLDALRRGQFKRAIEIADTHEPERSALWQLALAMEMNGRGRTEEARLVLEHLARKNLSPLEDWENTCAEIMLCCIYPADEGLVTALGESLVGEFDGAVSRALGRLGRFGEASSAAERIVNKKEQAEHFIGLAEAQRSAGRTADSHQTLALIREKAARIEFSFDKKTLFEAMKAIFDDQLKQTDYEGAVLSAGILSRLWSDAYCQDRPQDPFLRIAETQLRSNDAPSASRTMEAAIESASARDIEELYPIADFQAKWKGSGDAEKTFELALRAIREREPGSRHGGLLKAAKALAAAGFPDKARSVFSEAWRDIESGPHTPWGGVYEDLIGAQLECGITDDLLAKVNQAIREGRASANASQRATALARLAQALHKLSKTEEARKLFTEALELAQALEKESERVRALGYLGVLLAEVGEFDAAKKIADGPFGETVNEKIAPVQAQTAGLGAALETVNSIPDDYTRARTLADIADQIAEKQPAENAERVFELALETARKMKDGEARAQTFRYISRLQFKRGCLRAELKKTLLRECVNARYNEYREWNRHQDLLGLAQDLASWHSFPEAIKATRAITLDKKRDESWKLVARALAESGRIKTALQLVPAIKSDTDRSAARQAIAAALRPLDDFELVKKTVSALLGSPQKFGSDRPSRPESLLAIAKTLLKGGNTAQGFKTLLAAREEASSIQDLETRAKLIRNIALTELKFGDADQALETARLTADKEKKAALFREIARRQIQSGHLDAAAMTADAIEKDTGEYRELILESLAKACLASGDILKAKHIAERIKQGYYRKSVVPRVAAALVDKDDDSSALELAAGEKDVTIRMEIEAAIAIAQAKKGRAAAAIASIGRIGRGAGFVSPSKYRAIQEAARSSSQSAAIFNLVEIAGKFEDNEDRAKALSVTASELAKAGRSDESRKLFSEAVETAGAVAEAIILKNEALAKAREEIRKRMLEDAQKKGMSKRIIDRLERPSQASAQLGGLSDPDEKQAKALLAVGQAQAEAGETALALKTAQMIGRKEEKESLFQAISEQQAKRGHFADAYSTSQKIESDDKQSAALKSLALAQLAREGLVEAIATVKLIRNKDTAADILTSTARQWLRSGQRQKAARLIRATAEIASTVPNWGYLSDQHDHILLNVAGLWAAAGDFREALQAVGLVFSGLRKPAALRQIVDEMAKRGEYDQALRTAESELSAGEAAEALISIALAQAERGSAESARRTLEKAMETAGSVHRGEWKAESYAKIAMAYAQAGFGSDAVQTAALILQEKNRWILEVVKILCDNGDSVNFKKLLLPGSSFPETADAMCGYLAQLYPAQADEIGAILLKTR
ncbi:MAG: hypothetical protein A2Y69_05625 [Candidatus Aminicenantes bacterium RBG_13_59_9]|nr:MAG: hypothetical protein A2Y69_05625 [Candidatus Aminicenantes bacterium RBG_13_59_9]